MSDLEDLTHNQTDSDIMYTGEITEPAEYKKMLGMIGIAKRAGFLVSGTPSVLSEIRTPKQRRKIGVVLLSDGCSNNTRKQVVNACTFYNVPLRIVKIPPGELGHSIGKSGEICAVAVKEDMKLTQAVLKKIDEFEEKASRGVTS